MPSCTVPSAIPTVAVRSATAAPMAAFVHPHPPTPPKKKHHPELVLQLPPSVTGFLCPVLSS